jgi:type III pantothenate kinase
VNASPTRAPFGTQVATADIGNGATKVVWWGSGVDRGPRAVLGHVRVTLPRVEHARNESSAQAGAAFAEALAAAFEHVAHVLVSCVASDEVHARVSAAARAAGARVHEHVRERSGPAAPAVAQHLEHGLDLSACRNVHTIGADRLWAARGAWERAHGPALVVDAGTAVTVDALGVAAHGGPAFLGGAIAPGADLLRRALGAGAARLFEVELPIASDGAVALADVPALGRESAEALRSGVVHGLRGAVRELARLVALEARLAGAPRFVTGGGAAWLLAAPPVIEHAEHVPLLVHEGLLAAFDQSASSGAASTER